MNIIKRIGKLSVHTLKIQSYIDKIQSRPMKIQSCYMKIHLRAYLNI